MESRAATLLLALLLLASGCLGASGEDLGGTPESSPDDSSPDRSSSHAPKTKPHSTTAPTPPSTSEPPASGGNETPPTQTEQKPWPNLGSATIRPGVQVTSSAGQCTSNFLFRSPDNATLYLGTASHCVDGLKIGDNVQIDGASKPGKVAYSAWIALNLKCESDATNTGCTSGQFENDFALVAIDAADRAKVHPAVLHFGGPKALGDSSKLSTGARVLVYGQSGLWFGVESLHHHEGAVTAAQSGVQFRILTFAPGVPGDSGSGVQTRAGDAVGILATACLAPCTGQNGVVGLQGQLELAKKHGLDAVLATWPLLDDGIVP